MVAFIYDQYLYDIDNAILYYRSFLDRFPDYQSAEIASQRLAIIEESVKHQLDVINHKSIYDKSLSFLSDNQLDSTIHTLNKIQDSNYETPFKVVANQLLNKINLLLDINFKINEQQIEKDSINYLEIVDSLFYFKSQVFNDLGNLDSCLFLD